MLMINQKRANQIHTLKPKKTSATNLLTICSSRVRVSNLLTSTTFPMNKLWIKQLIFMLLLKMQLLTTKSNLVWRSIPFCHKNQKLARRVYLESYLAVVKENFVVWMVKSGRLLVNHLHNKLVIWSVSFRAARPKLLICQVYTTLSLNHYNDFTYYRFKFTFP